MNFIPHDNGIIYLQYKAKMIYINSKRFVPEKVASQNDLICMSIFD